MRFVFLLLSSLLVCLELCAAPLRVVALHPVLEEFVLELGGGTVEVVGLLPAGSDPHAFNPAPADVKRISSAQLVLATGLGLEPWLGRLIVNSGFKGVLLEAGSVISNPVRSSHSHEKCTSGHHHGEETEHDPHWWHGIAASRDVARAIASRLQSLQPEQSAAISGRLQVLEARLARLSAWAELRIAKIPPARRILVTSHDAFGYLAHDYGISVHPLSGVSPEAEPDARALAGMIDFIRREKVPTLFPDNGENPRLLAMMLKESGARLGGVLYADGPAAAGTGPATQEAMFRHNLDCIVQGLEPASEKK